MNISEHRHIFSSGILRLVGYGLLLMALVDFIFLLIPPNFMNPIWELQTIGAVVERIPVTLLGIVLVYYGEREARAPVEIFVLRWLSRLSLLIAILMLLTIPLTISNSFRIYYQHNAGINTQVVGKIDAIDNFKEELEQANSSKQIGSIIQKQAKQQIRLPDSVNTDQLKHDILQDLQTNQENLRKQANSIRSQKRLVLLKNCFKWNLGSLIAALLFFIIWKSTLWARLEVDLDN